MILFNSSSRPEYVSNLQKYKKICELSTKDGKFLIFYFGPVLGAGGDFVYGFFHYGCIGLIEGFFPMKRG